MSPMSLLSSKLWWNGPSWLVDDACCWPKDTPSMEQEIPEQRKTILISSFHKLIRITAYCLRFINNCQRHKTKLWDPIEVPELERATQCLVKNVQATAFTQELRCLQLSKPLPRNSKLLSLNPFVDKGGHPLIRVGERLQHAKLSYSSKHQLVLPANHPFTKMLIEREHIRLLHGGAQMTLASVRQRYWPVNGRRIVRQVIHKCIRCFKTSPKSIQQIMGNLPEQRVQPSRPFSNVGIDFCGPFSVRESKRSEEGIKWHFIPPRAPNFGGIWEASVKVFKTHLKKVAGASSLTLEEMQTLTVQIESVLNSRPLISLSNDPNDLSYLSPGHFLVGDVLTTIPETTLQHIPENRLSRWQRVEKMKQHFWNRWSKDYLNQLQQRNKWQKQRIPIQRGDLVLIREDNIPPLHWPAGRVHEVHPGEDGVIRAATIKTSKGLFKRSANRFCLFPTKKD
ncbi:PREDICTED: uncharacterized protein LOC105449475 [Wasmannia auropunctata]|uniref:uncharacterized protein LOC105449475 n=1 Tax=Wasmannia auropunctata TaxID=64793 RepID=UPI0005ED92CB|nr:PREDICTED: uncharacterized protein LOC105449475 [Wasmannia auropunctata]